MTLMVCRHGNRIEVEFEQPVIGAGFYRQTVKMPMCKQCICDAAMIAMENQTRPLHDQIVSPDEL